MKLLQCDKRTILIITVFHIFFGLLFFTLNPFAPAQTTTTTPYTTAPVDDLSEQQESLLLKNKKENQNAKPDRPIEPSQFIEKRQETTKSTLLLLFPQTSGGIHWPELGNTGWKKPTRLLGESLLKCSDARSIIAGVYDEAASKVNFKAGPKFGMPWFFHDPFPICGSILLRHLHGTLDTVPVLRISENQKQLQQDTQKIDSSTNSFSSSKLLLNPAFQTQERDFKDTFGQVDYGKEVIDVVAGVEFNHAAFIDECGDGNGFSQILYTARLVSYNFKTVAKIEAKTTENNNKVSRTISFIAPAPGSYVLEVKTVHANGTSDNPRVPRSLGVVGIRANIANRKAFMYNTRCDYQRHVLGSPMLVRAHDAKSEIGRRILAKIIMTSSTTKIVSDSSSFSNVPLCTRADHDHGFWARIQKPEFCHSGSNPFCAGDPGWVSDASAYNTQYVWVPTTMMTTTSSRSIHINNPACKFYYWTPPQGPGKSCLRYGDARAFLYLVGDSVIREYAKNCDLISLRSAKLQCLFANIALEGQHFSNSYADSVAKTIVTNIRENNAGVFATNLGLQHMIGPCTTKQWRIFVRYFVLYWKQQIVWQRGADPNRKRTNDGVAAVGDVGRTVDSTSEQHLSQEEIATRKELDSLTISSGNQSTGENNNNEPLNKDGANNNNNNEKLQKFYFGPKILRSKTEMPKLEQAIWIGPPTIQYARKGMGAERAALWDEIAWRELEPLGFQRMKTIPVTASRQEGTWDGLHYASEKGKVQTVWKNKEAKVYRWNGGIANVLFTMLLNVICNR